MYACICMRICRGAYTCRGAVCQTQTSGVQHSRAPRVWRGCCRSASSMHASASRMPVDINPRSTSAAYHQWPPCLRPHCLALRRLLTRVSSSALLPWFVVLLLELRVGRRPCYGQLRQWNSGQSKQHTCIWPPSGRLHQPMATGLAGLHPPGRSWSEQRHMASHTSCVIMTQRTPRPTRQTCQWHQGLDQETHWSMSGHAIHDHAPVGVHPTDLQGPEVRVHHRGTEPHPH